MNCTELNSNTIYVYIQTYQLGEKIPDKSTG